MALRPDAYGLLETGVGEGRFWRFRRKQGVKRRPKIRPGGGKVRNFEANFKGGEPEIVGKWSSDRDRDWRFLKS